MHLQYIAQSLPASLTVQEERLLTSGRQSLIRKRAGSLRKPSCWSTEQPYFALTSESPISAPLTPILTTLSEDSCYSVDSLPDQHTFCVDSTTTVSQNNIAPELVSNCSAFGSSPHFKQIWKDIEVILGDHTWTRNTLPRSTRSIVELTPDEKKPHFSIVLPPSTLPNTTATKSRPSVARMNVCSSASQSKPFTSVKMDAYRFPPNKDLQSSSAYNKGSSMVEPVDVPNTSDQDLEEVEEPESPIDSMLMELGQSGYFSTYKPKTFSASSSILTVSKSTTSQMTHSSTSSTSSSFSSSYTSDPFLHSLSSPSIQEIDSIVDQLPRTSSLTRLKTSCSSIDFSSSEKVSSRTVVERVRRGSSGARNTPERRLWSPKSFLRGRFGTKSM